MKVPTKLNNLNLITNVAVLNDIQFPHEWCKWNLDEFSFSTRYFNYQLFNQTTTTA